MGRKWLKQLNWSEKSSVLLGRIFAVHNDPAKNAVDKEEEVTLLVARELRYFYNRGLNTGRQQQIRQRKAET